MGKKGALTSIFSRSRLAVDSPAGGGGSSSPPWPWPSCRDPQTDSFRAGEEPCTSDGSGTRCDSVAARQRKLATAGEMYKTVNSVYFDPNDDGEPCGCLDDEDGVVVDDDGFLTTAASEEWSEAVIRSLGRTVSSTDRFFFDLQGPVATNSILAATASASSSPAARTAPLATAAAEDEEERAGAAALTSDSEMEKLPDPPCYSRSGGKSLAEESVAVAVDSADPYRDFRASMEEMVAAHGLRGWDSLEELLVWYLRVNAKRNHELIVGAFVDLLLSLASATPPSSTSTAATTATTTTTASSTSSSSSSASSSTTKSTSTTTTTTSTAAAAAATEQGGGGGSEACASCLSSSSCVPSDQEEAGEKD